MRGSVTQIREKREELASRLATVSDIDFAWFCGWLCADGSIMDAGNGRPRIRFGITDRDVLDRMSGMFGNKVSSPIRQHGLGTKDIFEWSISGWYAAEILRRAAPFLSDRYRERANRVMQVKYRDHSGHKLTPASVATIKRRLVEEGHGAGRRLAREYGVTSGLITSIKTGRTWADIDQEVIAA